MIARETGVCLQFRVVYLFHLLALHVNDLTGLQVLNVLGDEGSVLLLHVLKQEQDPFSEAVQLS